MMNVWCTEELCLFSIMVVVLLPTFDQLYHVTFLQLPTTPTWDDFRLLSRHLRAESTNSIVITDEDGTPVEVRRPRARSLRSVSVHLSVCSLLCSSSVCLSVCPLVYVSSYLSAHPSICQSICLDMTRCVCVRMFVKVSDMDLMGCEISVQVVHSLGFQQVTSSIPMPPGNECVLQKWNFTRTVENISQVHRCM